MKKFLPIILIISLLCLTLFVSCKKQETDSGNTNDSPSENSGSDAIYSKDSELGMRYGEEVYGCEAVGRLYTELYARTNLKKLGMSDGVMEHEIVIGMSDLSVSTEAYRRLGKIKLSPEEEDNPKGYTRCLVYTDGRSIAIAFDEQIDFISLQVAIEYVLNNLVLDSLAALEGTLFSAVTDIQGYYEAEDKAMLEKKWEKLTYAIGNNGEEVVLALKDLYSVYSDDLISWMANLYEPTVCVCIGECKKTPNCIGGGFYYSNSARSTLGYLPDVESTKQLLSILENSGMVTSYADELPEEIMNSIVAWVKSLQAEDGYFYHPQWGTSITSSRRNRDLSSAVAIIKAAGASPTYTTPTGVKGDGVKPTSYMTKRLGESIVGAASNVIMTANITDPNLKDKESFIAYLESLDIKNNSYVAGNTLAAYASVIKARDKELKADGKSYSLFDIMIEHLNSTQNPDNGTWYWVNENSTSYSLYTAVNGLMKISCVYEDSLKMMPNADKALETAIKAITSEQEAKACVDVYNTWFAISNIFTIYTNVGGADNLNKVKEARKTLIQDADELIMATALKLSAFRKDDGSFSYNVKYSAYESQGSLAAVPKTEEGDVNATTICTTGTVSLIYDCLGLESHTVPIYTRTDFLRFVDIITELSHVMKDELEMTIPVEEIDNHGIGKYKDQAIDFEKVTETELLTSGIIGTDKPEELDFGAPTSQKNVSIYEACLDDPHTKALSFKKLTAETHIFIFMRKTRDQRATYLKQTSVCSAEKRALRIRLCLPSISQTAIPCGADLIKSLQRQVYTTRKCASFTVSALRTLISARAFGIISE